jgi:hypothetical protein
MIRKLVSTFIGHIVSSKYSSIQSKDASSECDEDTLVSREDTLESGEDALGFRDNTLGFGEARVETRGIQHWIEQTILTCREATAAAENSRLKVNGVVVTEKNGRTVNLTMPSAKYLEAQLLQIQNALYPAQDVAPDSQASVGPHRPTPAAATASVLIKLLVQMSMHSLPTFIPLPRPTTTDDAFGFSNKPPLPMDMDRGCCTNTSDCDARIRPTHLLCESLLAELRLWFQDEELPYPYRQHFMDIGLCMEQIYEAKFDRVLSDYVAAIIFINTYVVIPALLLKIPVDVALAVTYRAHLRARGFYRGWTTNLQRQPGEVVDVLTTCFIYRAFVLDKIALASFDERGLLKIKKELLLRLDVTLFPLKLPSGPFRESRIVQECSKHFRGLDLRRNELQLPSVFEPTFSKKFLVGHEIESLLRSSR